MDPHGSYLWLIGFPRYFYDPGGSGEGKAPFIMADQPTAPPNVSSVGNTGLIAGFLMVCIRRLSLAGTLGRLG